MGEAAVTEIRHASGRVPPHSLEAEGAVVSAVFIKPETFYEAQAWINSRDFYADANRRIYEAFEALEAENTAIDVVTVAAWLRARERLAQVGGTPYLLQIQDATPFVANVGEHARIIAGHSHQRRLIATFQTLAAEGYGDIGDPFEWAQRAEHDVYEAANRERGSDEDGTLEALIPGVIDQAVAQSKGDGEPPGISTGLPTVDARINGLKRAKVYLVAGRPGMGKSALIGQLNTNVSALGYLVVEISTEQKRDELARRKIAQTAGVSYAELEAGRLSSVDWARVASQAERLRALPLSIEFMTAPTISGIRGAIRRALSKLRRKHGDLPVGLISVDQIGHLDAQSRRDEHRESEVSRLSKELTWLAGEFDCPVLVAAQLNRKVEERPDKRPLLSDLRDSGALEQDAYGVLFPFRPKYYERGKTNLDAAEECEIIIAKHKNGPAGSIDLMFHGPSMAFDTPSSWSAGERQTAMAFKPPPADGRFA